MKAGAALILILLYNIHNVKSFPVFESVAKNLKEFAESFVSALRTIKTKVRYFLTSHFKNKEYVPPSNDEYIFQQKTRRAFSGIIEERTQNSETEIPELYHFKSEPTALMTTPQLAKYQGKRIESHVVVTGDGYLLTVHRLMRPLDEPLSGKLLNPTVLLHHGLLGSSADWILLGPKKSLPYILASIGYDVWMTNARGNYYSRGHVTKKDNSLDYWKFSWEEMGIYDLPAVVDYIRKLKKTNDTMDFIGHSMGATALLVMLSTIPSYNQYFRLGILLAPLAFMSNIEGPLRIFTSMAMNLPEDSLTILGDGEFFSSRKIPSWIVKKYCNGPVLYCSNPLLFLAGSIPRLDTWNSSLVANIIHHLPAGGSTNTILHYAHLVETGKFQKFREKNEFPLKKVTLPIALFSSSDDCLATIPDVLKLYFSISNPIDHFIIRSKNLSHSEFVFGPDADVLIFNKVIDILQQGLSHITLKRNEV